MTLRVVSLRRYPVKSMGGEALDAAPFDARGLAGDRAWAVRDADGRLASGKNTRRMVRRDGVFGYAATTDADGVVTITGPDGALGLAGEATVDAALARALGAAVAVAPETDVKHFDDGSVSLIGTATLAWCARELGVDADPRRLRVNVVVETTEPFEEEGWFGREVTLGDAAAESDGRRVVLRPVERIERCRTIDLAQDGAEGTTRWLKGLGAMRDLRVAVYCDVALPGTARVGDPVTLGPRRSLQ